MYKYWFGSPELDDCIQASTEDRGRLPSLSMRNGPQVERARVAVCQIPLSVGDRSGNLEVAEEAINYAVETGAQIVVLPELVNSGYVFRSLDEARSLAEPLDGVTVDSWHRLASDNRLVVVGGLCELDREGRVRNSAVIVDNSGVAACYRKAHLWDIEKDFFEPGDEQPPVVDTPFGRVSTMICYDVEFPEWVRLAALSGADILCLPTNWPRLQPDPGPYPVEVLRVLAEANMNLIFIAAAGRLGHERGVDWVAGSGIAGPSGEWLTPLTEKAGVLVADLDPLEARRKETSPRNHQFDDRRPELYGDLIRSTTIGARTTIA